MFTITLLFSVIYLLESKKSSKEQGTAELMDRWGAI
jgi:hypothetical protein